jgi:DNA-binding NarL/FixJ family response regulator
MLLSHRDLSALQKTILELYACRDLATFTRKVPQLLLTVTPDADLSERGRLLLDLLRPHVDQARRNAEMAGARNAALPGSLARYGLTPRQADVAHWLGRGKTNHEIARILSSSSRTVEKHVERILEKLEVENRTAAAVIIAEAGAGRT